VLSPTFSTDSGNSASAETSIIGVINDGSDALILGSGFNDTLTTNTKSGAVIQGFAGNDFITGGDKNGSSTTEKGNNTIFGGSGNDTIIGGSGQDIIFGGAGSDVMRGGFANGPDTDQDTFVWRLGEQGTGLNGVNIETDSILDFQQGLGGDILDFSQLLIGETATNYTNYLNLTGTTLLVDTTGDGSGTDLIVELNNLAPGTTLASLIANNNITFDSINKFILRGTVNNDIINGTTANEAIYGGGATNLGAAESLRGGGGKDSFIYLSSDVFTNNPTTRIRDFTKGTGAEADTLNLADLLQGESFATINQFITIQFDSYTELGVGVDLFRIDIDGVGGPNLTLDFKGGVNFGTTGNNQLAILQQLITDGNLIIDN
jgi:hypothetical protein